MDLLEGTIGDFSFKPKYVVDKSILKPLNYIFKLFQIIFFSFTVSRMQEANLACSFHRFVTSSCASFINCSAILGCDLVSILNLVSIYVKSLTGILGSLESSLNGFLRFFCKVRMIPVKLPVT